MLNMDNTRLAIAFIFSLVSFCHAANFIPFQTVQDCKKGPTDTYHEMYDKSQLKCQQCSQTRQYQTVSADGIVI